MLNMRSTEIENNKKGRLIRPFLHFEIAITNLLFRDRICIFYHFHKDKGRCDQS